MNCIIVLFLHELDHIVKSKNKMKMYLTPHYRLNKRFGSVPINLDVDVGNYVTRLNDIVPRFGLLFFSSLLFSFRLSE